MVAERVAAAVAWRTADRAGCDWKALRAAKAEAFLTATRATGFTARVALALARMVARGATTEMVERIAEAIFNDLRIWG
jgi:hypothetical protein